MKEALSAAEETKVSKFISLLLRHKPWEVNLYVDEHGWANTAELCSKLDISENVLKHIVDTDAKGRYEFNGDGTKIRARYGHSINVDVGLTEMVPPCVLYHGTSIKAAEQIEQEGIKPMSRQYVHLSKDYNEALGVGRRHGTPVVFGVHANKMHTDNNGGYYYTSNGIWVTHKIPKEYIWRIR